MERTFIEQLGILTNLFTGGFDEAYQSANKRKRRRIMPYISALHRRWMYATLIEGTPFSPANVVESIARYYGHPAEKFVQPILVPGARYNGFDMRITDYSKLQPAVADLYILLEYCLPHADIQEGDFLFDAQMLELAQKLSIADPAYASFLMDIAFNMKLIEKKPSLYVNRVAPLIGWQDKLARPHDDVFNDIVNAAVQVCALHMRALIALPENLFTDNFVWSMLTNPICTDELFERVYDILGYTLDDLVELSTEVENVDIESEDGMFLAGTYLTGLILDQHFFTPFGYFLKLIKPHYVLPFDFNAEFTDFLAGKMPSDEEVYVVFYAPCSNYTLTDLGLHTLKVKRNDDNYFDIEKHVPFEMLKDSLFADPLMMEVLIKMAQLIPPEMQDRLHLKEVLHFRIRNLDRPTMWMNLHVPPELTLIDLYDEVLPFFALRENGDYSFFHDNTANRFAEYPSPKRAKTHAKKTADIALSALDFNRQAKMLMQAYGQSLPFKGKSPTITLEWEMLGIVETEPKREYPYIARMSKALQNATEEYI
ncbi:MAG: hypothetical protein FWC71_03165 [Defluviitaleaceae bacterium]|nr:hypothetical protein [Defluviitaleaceae bacterium]